jgi:serine/threonine-protein kinase HipA
MQRAERRRAERDGRAIRTLTETDYLLGVSDETRLGALRFRWVSDETFQATARAGVPALIELGRLLQFTERILRDEETDEDLQLIFAPGSSLGGARPKASVIDQRGHLSIALLRVATAPSKARFARGTRLKTYTTSWNNPASRSRKGDTA